MAVPVEKVEAVDVHAHYGIPAGDHMALEYELTSGYGEKVVERARAARTAFTFVSPLLALVPQYGGDTLAGNEEAARVVSEVPGLRQWVVVDPLNPETYAQAALMLQNPKCIGIKIHPWMHGYPIKEYGDRIFRFASTQAAGGNIVIETHTGDTNSQPEEFVPFADEYPDVILIMSHLGHSIDNDLTHQVRAIQAGKRNNLFTDTSSSRMVTSGLLEWAVGEIGAEHILYGTDSPLYFAASRRARVDFAEMDDQAKRMILRENAARLFQLEED